jgi:hypothetical protein
MAGGLLNLIAVGNANVFLNGNPTKTFFTVTYSKYTNFGLQKFRIDYNGSRDLRLTEPSTFIFKISKHADLLLDTYLVLSLPDIWSPVYPPTAETGNKWAPYDFRWIEDLGTHMIREIEINCGSFTLARYSGDYLAAMVDRDFTTEKKALFNQMTGNTIELNNPANAYGRFNAYPSAFFREETNAISGTNTTTGVEPSIRGGNLYIPLNTWFCLNSRCAFPLIALQYNELEIRVTLRPIQELFQVRDVFDHNNPNYQYPYIQPDFNQDRFQMYRFLQSPLKGLITDNQAYLNKFNTWNSDVHLLCTYAFLSKEEAKLFAYKDQVYLLKDVYTHKFDNIYGSKKVKLESTGMVSNWMWYFQRNDVNMRNEWSNYTNWPYRKIPSDIQNAPNQGIGNSGYNLQFHPASNNEVALSTGLFISGDYNVENQKHIMQTMGIVLDGKYRENTLTRGVFDYIEKYVRTNGYAKEGLYCYQFCLDTNPFIYQPSGALNLGKFNIIELEFVTHTPQIDSVRSNYDIICDENGNAIAVNKSNWRLYEYTYNLVLFEERYNILSFIGGNAGLLYSR